MKKILKFICIASVMGCMLSGCVSPNMRNNHPTKQKGTTWCTEDGKVVFYIPEDSFFPKGVIQTEDGPVDIVLGMTAQYFSVDVCYAKDFKASVENTEFPAFETWHILKVRNNVFIVETQESIYFEKGQILKFYKTD